MDFAKSGWRRADAESGGGARVIYYYFVSESRIAMLFVFPKNVRTDLSTEQKRILCKIVETWRQPP